MLPLLVLSALSNAATVRDNFDTQSYGNNDGTNNWSGNWIEVDPFGGGPAGGQVRITGGGELRLEDRPNTSLAA